MENLPREAEKEAGTLKRDNWTNTEVIDIVGGFGPGARLGRKDGVGLHTPLDDEHRHYNTGYMDAVAQIIEQFGDFRIAPEFHQAMAYDTEKKEIFVIGPRLPR